MAQHVVAYGKNIITAGTLQALTPVPDPTVTINVNDLSVPANYNQLLRAISVAGNTNAARAQLQSPSLRALFFPEISPYNSGYTNSVPGLDMDLAQNPIQLVTNEGLEFWSDGGSATPGNAVYGLVFFGDGAVAPGGGRMFTIRATAAAAAALFAWSSSALTFDQTLPVGTYDILGMRVEAAGVVAARLIFIGASAITRPGVPANASASESGDPKYRYGRQGVLGTFISTNPPSIELIGGSSTSQVVYLDLIKRS